MWKMERLFKWEILSKEEIGGFERNVGVLGGRKDSAAPRGLDGASEAGNGELRKDPLYSYSIHSTDRVHSSSR